MVSQGANQCKKFPKEEIADEFVCSRQQEMKTFSSKDDNVKIWVEVIIVTFFVCSGNRRCSHGKQ